jgi:hypothetical protein
METNEMIVYQLKEAAGRLLDASKLEPGKYTAKELEGLLEKTPWLFPEDEPAVTIDAGAFQGSLPARAVFGMLVKFGFRGQLEKRDARARRGSCAIWMPKEVKTAAAYHTDELRPNYAGVLLDLDGRRLVCTDCYRLYVSPVELEEEKGELSGAVVIPIKTAKALAGSFVRVELVDGGAYVDGVSCSMASGSLLDVDRVIGGRRPFCVSLEPKEFKGAARRKETVFLQFVAGEKTAIVDYYDQGEAKVGGGEIPIREAPEKSFWVLLPAGVLVDGLKIGDGTLWASENGAALFGGERCVFYSLSKTFTAGECECGAYPGSWWIPELGHIKRVWSRCYGVVVKSFDLNTGKLQYEVDGCEDEVKVKTAGRELIPA